MRRHLRSLRRARMRLGFDPSTTQDAPLDPPSLSATLVTELVCPHLRFPSPLLPARSLRWRWGTAVSSTEASTLSPWEQADHNRGQRQRWDGRTGLLARLNHGCDLLAGYHAQRGRSRELDRLLFIMGGAMPMEPQPAGDGDLLRDGQIISDQEGGI